MNVRVITNLLLSFLYSKTFLLFFFLFAFLFFFFYICLTLVSIFRKLDYFDHVLQGTLRRLHEFGFTYRVRAAIHNNKLGSAQVAMLPSTGSQGLLRAAAKHDLVKLGKPNELAGNA